MSDDVGYRFVMNCGLVHHEIYDYRWSLLTIALQMVSHLVMISYFISHEERLQTEIDGKLQYPDRSSEVRSLSCYA